MELVSDRSSSLASQSEVRLGACDLLLLRIVLDAVEAEDQIDRLLRDRHRRQCLVKVAAQVRMAGSDPLGRIPARESPRVEVDAVEQHASCAASLTDTDIPYRRLADRSDFATSASERR